MKFFNKKTLPEPIREKQYREKKKQDRKKQQREKQERKWLLVGGL